MATSVLLIGPEPAASAVAQALRRELDARVELTTSARGGLAVLRREEFSLLLLEENMAAADPETTDALYASAGSAPVLEINFGICGPTRVLRQVRSALQRRTLDQAKARTAAAASLQHELNASLTGLLLESQLAAKQAGPDLLPALEHLIALAAELREQLRG